jgi:transcription initiation factor TFIIF subunit alpha
LGLNAADAEQPVPPPPTDFTEKTPPGAKVVHYRLRTTKRDLADSIRFHTARFGSKKEINPADQNEFVRPVSLHRRDPRQPPAGRQGKDEDIPMEDVMDDKEREKQEIARAAKDAQRAADLAQIAPSGNNASALAQKKYKSAKNEKTTKVYKLAQTAEDQKASELRYEEALPWHLEDAENKHTWVGSYEAALSDTNVVLVKSVDGEKVYRMIPIEKWYKFMPKNMFKTFSIEEAEAQMAKKVQLSRWARRTEEKKADELKNEKVKREFFGPYSKVSGEKKNMRRDEAKDQDELDFNTEDLFHDDDEAAAPEPDNDEESKEAQERIKREMMGANLGIAGEVDELEVDRELEEIRKEQEARKQFGKDILKKLIKREKNYTYEDDDDKNPYDDESVSTGPFTQRLCLLIC